MLALKTSPQIRRYMAAIHRRPALLTTRHHSSQCQTPTGCGGRASSKDHEHRCPPWGVPRKQVPTYGRGETRIRYRPGEDREAISLASPFWLRATFDLSTLPVSWVCAGEKPWSTRAARTTQAYAANHPATFPWSEFGRGAPPHLQVPVSLPLSKHITGGMLAERRQINLSCGLPGFEPCATGSRSALFAQWRGNRDLRVCGSEGKMYTVQFKCCYTLFVVLVLAPACTSLRTTCVWPAIAAWCSAVWWSVSNASSPTSSMVSKRKLTTDRRLFLAAHISSVYCFWGKYRDIRIKC